MHVAKPPYWSVSGCPLMMWQGIRTWIFRPVICPVLWDQNKFHKWRNTATRPNVKARPFVSSYAFHRHRSLDRSIATPRVTLDWGISPPSLICSPLDNSALECRNPGSGVDKPQPIFLTIVRFSGAPREEWSLLLLLVVCLCVCPADAVAASSFGCAHVFLVSFFALG